jgi:hypothetical protein
MRKRPKYNTVNKGWNEWSITIVHRQSHDITTSCSHKEKRATLCTLHSYILPDCRPTGLLFVSGIIQQSTVLGHSVTVQVQDDELVAVFIYNITDTQYDGCSRLPYKCYVELVTQTVTHSVSKLLVLVKPITQYLLLSILTVWWTYFRTWQCTM